MNVRPLQDCYLYTFLDEHYLGDRDIRTVAEQLCDGGSDIIQLRFKKASLDQLHQVIDQVRPILSRYGVALVVNDHLSLATHTGVDVLHMGQEDFDSTGKTDASALFSPGRKSVPVGLSTHSPEQAAIGVAGGFAYLGVGPVFATPTKPGRLPVGLSYVSWARKNLTIPWFAIGGINLRSVQQVMDAGAIRICVVSEILNSSNIVSTCRTFKQIITSNQV